MQEKEQMFQNLVDENLPMLRSAANGILNNVADADDAVQIALLKVREHLTGFVSRTKLTNMAYTAVLNAAKEIYRKKFREQRNLAQFEDKLNCKTSSYSVMLENLTEAVIELPRELRTVVTMVALNGMAPEEAAGKLGLHVKTLYRKINKAKTLLRKKLGIW